MQIYFPWRTFFLLSLLFFLSCKVKTVEDKVTNDILKVNNIYIQEEVPGTRGEESKLYLNIQLAPFSTEQIILDSILFKSLFYKEVKIPTTNYTRTRIYKREKALLIDDGTLNSVVFYFKKDNQTYLQNINNVLIKEPIYLP